MVGGWYIGSRLSNGRTYGNVTTTSLGTVITASGSTNTKGSYTQLISSTVGDTAAIYVAMTNVSSSGVAIAMDIAVGAAASEQVIIPNILSSTNNSFSFGMMFPVQIPSGTRISARIQATTASDTIRASVTLFADAAIGRSGSVIDILGFTAATTIGTSVDPGGTANTKGAYSQIIASTAVDYSGFCFCLSTLSRTSAGTNSNMALDVAVGAGGSEIIIVPDYQFVTQGTGNAVIPIPSPWYEMEIKLGTRIAVRSQCSINTAASRTFGFVMYGLRA